MKGDADIVIGDFLAEPDDSDRLRVVFHPGDGSRQWRQAAWTADFASSWFGDAPCGADEIAYALNELVENAIKFASSGAVVIEVSRGADELILRVDNRAEVAAVPTIEARFSALVTGDPWAMMIERVEANAADPDTVQSGLGFLSLLTDYNARLGWCISSDGQPDGQVLLSTMARLPMHEDE